MRTVYKYRVGGAYERHTMSADAKVVKVDTQGREVYMWALTDTTAEQVARTFHVVGTGEPIPADLEYVGTWQTPPLVWHLFEERA